VGRFHKLAPAAPRSCDQLSRGSRRISTRRFSARPWSVSLLAIG
jgi:hypothetical protein